MSRRRSVPSLHRVEQAVHDMLAGRVPVGAGEAIALARFVALAARRTADLPIEGAGSS